MESHKVVVITGASRGIGAALAGAAAAEGHRVVINYRSGTEEAEALAAELARGPGQAIAVQADVSIAADADRLIATTVNRFGRLDGLVNNAGIGRVTTLEDLDEATFTKTLHVNLIGAFLASQAAWPHMTADGGRLVFMSSLAARTGGTVSAAYAASKGGVEGLMHYYATSLRQHRITSNAIAPAFIESDMLKSMDVPPADTLPLGRVGRAEELWPALRMILETEYLTGQTIHIDAGRYMT